MISCEAVVGQFNSLPANFDCQNKLSMTDGVSLYDIEHYGRGCSRVIIIPMHELAVTKSILDIALDHAERCGATRVTDLYLVIGQLSTIVDDSVQFYWDIVSKESKCAGAQLHFERIAAQMRCLDCDHTYAISSGLEACPQCAGLRVRVQAGDEFRLESIEVEMIEELV